MRLADDGDDVGVLDKRNPHRLIGVCRKRRKRRRRRQYAGRAADDPAVILLACRSARLGGRERRALEAEPGFRLGDVGARDIADLESIASRLEVSPEHADLIVVEFDDRPVADHIHVGSNGIGEDVALDCAQGRSPGLDPGSRGFDRIAHPAPLIKRQRQVDSARNHRALAPTRIEDSRAGKVAVEANRRSHLGPAGGTSDRDRGIGDLQCFALRVQRRIAAIGGIERLAQRVGRSRGRGNQRGQRDGGEQGLHKRTPKKQKPGDGRTRAAVRRPHRRRI